MTALLDVIARIFVAPRASEARRAAAVVHAPSAAVCGPGAEPLACALALLARRRGPAVVCVWSGGQPRAGAPATARARRIAASMAARGLEAQARGRLVIVALDATPSTAVGEAGRAAAAAGEAPVVVALGGPRDPAFDDLLVAQDLAIVAAQDAPEELVRLGVAALEQMGRPAVAAAALPTAATWAARAGLWATPGARRALAAATGALR